MDSMSELAHQFLKGALHQQAICIDATLGYGRDSQFFLDQNVSKVFAYEIQKDLLEVCKQKIDSPKFIPFLKGHETMLEDLHEYQGKVDAIVFNFGYDPKTIDGISTLPETSLVAVMRAVDLLKNKGRMALVFYSKPPGKEERELVMSHLQKRKDLDILESRRIDHPAAPILVCIQKRS